MKRKFSKILGIGLTLALLASMLVMAAPVAAVEEPTYGEYTLVEEAPGTAEWSIDEARSGKYSVKLYSDGTAAYGKVVMPLDMAFDADFEFSAWVEGGTTAQALPLHDIMLEMDATGVPVLTGGNNNEANEVDLNGMIVVLASQPGQCEDLSDTLMSDGIAGWEKYGTHSGADIDVGTGAYWSMFVYDGVPSIENWVGTYDYFTWDEIHSALDEKATVTEVRIELRYPENDDGYVVSAIYVDDIEINDTTFDLEPIALDAEGYSVVDTVGVTVCNSIANSDPVRIDEVEVSATSGSDAIGLTLTLEETGVNTGVFAVSFPTTGTTPPGVDELLVSDGDTITASYTGNWGAWGGLVTATAPVDETVPVFTSVTGEDFYKNTGTITLTATLDDAGYTVTANFSNIDSAYTTGDEVVTDESSDIYTITYTIDEENTTADGEYIIPVTAEDVAGNSTTNTSFSTTLDNTEPAVTDPTATPAVIQPSKATNVTFTANVTDGEDFSGVATVTVDLSSIGGSATQAMAEVLDEEEEPAVYLYHEFEWTDLSVTDEDTYTLPITATDALGNVNDTVDITLRVLLDVTPPEIVSTQVEYPVGAVSARVGDSVVITAVVTDDLAGVATVTVDATDIGIVDPPVVMPLVEGTTDTYSATLTVGTVDPDTYTLAITATDLAGLPDEDEATVDVEVVISLTGYNITLLEGWNLISLPLIPDVPAIEIVLALIADDVDIVWGYDPVNSPLDPWAYCMPGVIEGDLTNMVDGMGYWVLMLDSATLTISGVEMPEPNGVPVTPPTYNVASGWNLIGVKNVVPEGITLENYLGNLYDGGIPEFSVIWGYDTETGYFNVFPIGTVDLLPCQGYWLWMKVTGIVVPPQ